MKSIKLIFKQSDIVPTIQNISVEPNKQIQNVYLKSPLFNKCGVQVGYNVSNSLIQQVSTDNFVVRSNITYTLDGLGTINWQYNFTRPVRTTVFPDGILVEGKIISGTGKFLGATGKVKINPKADGTRYVVVKFD